MCISYLMDNYHSYSRNRCFLPPLMHDRRGKTQRLKTLRLKKIIQITQVQKHGGMKSFPISPRPLVTVPEEHLMIGGAPTTVVTGTLEPNSFVAATWYSPYKVLSMLLMVRVPVVPETPWVMRVLLGRGPKVPVGLFL